MVGSDDRARGGSAGAETKGGASARKEPERAAAAGGGVSSGGSSRSESAAASPGTQPSLLPAVSLPKGGGAVRGIGEKFTVNTATGTASLAIPLPASPGRGGQGPDVSLSYSSGAGNGPFGIGFQLSVPTISRKTDKGVPRYVDDAESDTFVLSGAEDLVPLLDDQGQHVFVSRGAHRAYRYRPRIEGLFARIERWVHSTSRDAHWRVTTKDDVTHVYGTSSATRIYDPDQEAHVFTWLLERTTDDKGNVTAYEYKAEDGRGVDPARLSERSRFDYSAATPVFTQTAQKYLKRVFYGNAAPEVAADFLFELVFDYGEHSPPTPTSVPSPQGSLDWSVREDPFSSYRTGFELRTYRLCRGVLMFHRLDAARAPLLVRSTELTYDASPVVTYLTGITQVGHLFDVASSTWTHQAMPTLALDYQRAVLHDELQVLPERSLEGLAGGADGARKQWVDLDGEGIPGILIDQGGSWFYKENLGSGVLSPPRQLATQPMPGAFAGGVQKLEDIDGDGRLELVAYEQRFSGYFERTESGTFDPLRQFESLPRINWNDPNLRFIDLDGDGHADLLITEDHALVFYRSRAKLGFEPAQRRPVSFDEDQGPHVVFDDPEQSIQLADMSGDGLVDIVRVRNGDLSYWPNLGHGQFGKKITLENCPIFANPEEFRAARVRLGDVDGSGTTDLFYAGRSGITLYLNESGNRLSDGVPIRSLPPVDSAAQLSVADLLGNGTSCLVWSSPLPHPAQTVLFVDLLNSLKPHVLKTVSNNLGATTTLTYASSTKFYLADKQAGVRWLTRLPFPVQVLERVERVDAISGGKLVTTYRYRHGFYDGFEREFRGFARVEQLDAEDFADEATDPLLYQPPVRVVSWHHTGAWLEKERLELALRNEYFQNGPPVLLVDDTLLPPGISVQDSREAARALKGSPLRTEVYADDGTALAALPYSITEQNQEVRLLQKSRGEDRYGVFFALSRETVSISTERNLADPRVSHELVLDVDDFGNVTRKLSLAYARAAAQPNSHPEQRVAYATLTEADFVHQADQDAFYRLGTAVEKRTYEITGLDAELSLPAAGQGLTNLNGARATLDALTPAAELPFEASPTPGTIQRRLIDRLQQTFYTEAGGGLGTEAALGTVGPHALPYRTYQLALTTGQVAQIIADSQALSGTPFDPALLLTEGRYAQRDAHYWTASGRVLFDAARFYLPVEAIDPFGAHSFVTYDDFALLVTSARDPLGNLVTSLNDYRVLAPTHLTDSNLNRCAVAFDALGMVVKTAVMGKANLAEGDTLENPTTWLLYDLLAFQARREPARVHTFAREQHLTVDPNAPIQETFTYSDGFGRVVLTKVQAEPAPGTTAPRWVGTGRTLFNNKGNPVKQYEPYFSPTSDFETEAEVVETGVTPILRYDSLDRLIRTDLPDGTFTKVEFDSWSQTSWDQNDTVFQSQWYVDRGAPAASGPEPSAPEARAAWLAAQHANTPTTSHLDTLGRPFLSDAHNRTDGLDDHYLTKTKQDIEGNTLAIFDSRQIKANAAAPLPTMEQTYDVLQRRIRVISADAGTRLTIADVAGKPLRSWDSRGQTHRQRFDALQRPTHLYVRKGAAERLLLRTVYGEALDPPGLPPTDPAFASPAQQANLRGRAHHVYDCAGLVVSIEHDFKGNPLSASRRLAVGYETEPDWTAGEDVDTPAAVLSAVSVLLQDETFTTESSFDALNRVATATAPDGSVTRPEYNEANLLEAVHVAVRGAAEAAVITDLDYNARGQRLLCAYANGATTTYQYDPKTFRLTEL
ncbi:MAG: toxin, partial [Myxococcales bacterium]